MHLRRHAALLAVYEAKAGARGEAVARATSSIEEFAGGDGELFRSQSLKIGLPSSISSTNKSNFLHFATSWSIYWVCDTGSLCTCAMCTELFEYVAYIHNIGHGKHIFVQLLSCSEH